MQKTLIGLGYDIHKLARKRNLIVGGVHIPYEFGLEGHSDGDCLTHSIIDALLGATNTGDIGRVFGVDKPETKNISSLTLLLKAWNMLKKDYRIVNIDTVIMAEKPRISPFIFDMKNNIAKVLEIDETQISIKSTSAKRLGEIGMSKAIACQAIANLITKK